MDDPFYFADQDVVNALFSSRLGDTQIECLEHRLAPHTPMRHIRIVDTASPACRYPDGTRPYLLHHTLAKPWLKSTVPNAYSRLLPRLLLAPDVTVRLSPGELPLRLRMGPAAAGARCLSGLGARGRTSARRQLGRLGIRTRLAARRADRAAASHVRSVDEPPTV
jgi:hypothetical protein